VLRTLLPVNLGVRPPIKSIGAMRMTCETCATIKQFSIPSPSKLTEAIRYCKELVASGTLIQSTYWPPRTSKFTATQWEALDDSGNWEDILQYYFECPSCKTIFLLHADTYHGGGSFKRADMRATPY
jgi:hypothetical protein